MADILFDIPRRVPKLDALIIIAVVVMVTVDLILIRDPLHTFLGVLMIPAAIRVANGFHSIRISTAENFTIESGWLGGVDRFEIPLDASIDIEEKSTIGTNGTLAIFVDGEFVCTLGHTCDASERVQLRKILTR